jgi:hypothetical protein
MPDFEITEVEDQAFPDGLFAQVITSHAEMCAAHPGGVLREAIGMHAWSKLTTEQRIHALPGLLGCYTGVVLTEERARQIDTEARKNDQSYLGDFDTAVLTDALFSVTEFLGKGIDVDVEVNDEALSNVLAELELLQHRVAMLRNEKDGDQ